MADIIDFEKFKKGPKKEVPSEERPRAANERIPSLNDPHFVDHLQDMTRVLMNMLDDATAPSSFSEANVQQRQAGLQEYAIADLSRMIWQSNSMDWAKNPSFYMAVGRELKLRISALREGR